MRLDTFQLSIYKGALTVRARYFSSSRAHIYLPSDRPPLELVLKEGKWCFTGVRTMTIARQALLRAWVAADLSQERKQVMSQNAKRHIIPTEDYRYVTFGDKLLRLSPINYQRFLSQIEQSKAEAIDWNNFDWKPFRPKEIGSPPLPLEGFTSAGATILLNGGTIPEALKAGLVQHEEAEKAEPDWQFMNMPDTTTPAMRTI